MQQQEAGAVDYYSVVRGVVYCVDTTELRGGRR